MINDDHYNLELGSQEAVQQVLYKNNVKLQDLIYK
jgi:hypothetical protein